MNDDGMLVSRRWLERVDEHVNKTDLQDKERHAGRSAHKTLRPVAIKGTWAKDANGVWKNWGRFVDSRDGAQDDRVAVDVWAPAASGSTAPPTGKAWIAWRGRWEVVGQSSAGETYQSGEGISISGTTTKTIDNTGVVSAQVIGSNYVDTGVLTFDGQFFKWDPSLTDTVGKRGLTLKQPTLVVNIQNDAVLTIGFAWGS